MSGKPSRQDQLTIVRDNIYNLRVARGWNIARVAELSGVPAEELMAIEDGADCRLDYLRKLCDLFDVRMTLMFRPLKEFRTER